MNTLMSKVYQIYSGNNWMTLSLISSYKGTLDQLIAKNHYYLTETLINSRLNPDLLNFQYTYKEISHWIRIEENPSRWPRKLRFSYKSFKSNKIKNRVSILSIRKILKKILLWNFCALYLSFECVGGRKTIFFSSFFVDPILPNFFFLDYVFQISIL